MKQEEVERITTWFCERDENSFATHADVYQKEVKVKVIRAYFKDLGFANIKSEATRDKLGEKIAGMIKSYKEMRQKADVTDWGVDPKDLDMPPSDQNYEGGPTIRQIIRQKCPWYYDFEEIFSDKPNVTPSYLSECGQSDRRNLRPVSEEETQEDPWEETQKPQRGFQDLLEKKQITLINTKK